MAVWRWFAWAEALVAQMSSACVSAGALTACEFRSGHLEENSFLLSCVPKQWLNSETADLSWQHLVSGEALPQSDVQNFLKATHSQAVPQSHELPLCS